MTILYLHHFERGPNAVATALAAAGEFCERTGIGGCPALAVIVEELVVNLVEHDGGSADDRIELQLAHDGDRIRLTLSDGGAPFDPRLAEQADLPPDRGGGAGLALVRAWSRIELYTRIGGRNHLQLLIPLDEAGDEASG